MLYLDHNATTFILPQVKELLASMLDKSYNPSSVYASGRRARHAVEHAREQVALSSGIDAKSKEYQVIFTSSGTESNNLIMANYYDGDIFISGTEHLSIYDHIKYTPNIKIIKVDKNGIIDLEHLDKLLQDSASDKKLVSVMLANNESGVIQDIPEVVKVARKYNAAVHSDCVQSFGKIALNITELGLDFASISAHKIGGIAGSSALIARQKYGLRPIMIGGGQEKNIRSGTENVIAVACFGLATELVNRELDSRYQQMKILQTHLEQNLLKYKNVHIVAQNTERLPNTSLIVVEGTDAMVKLIAFDMRNICVSSGSACSSGNVGKSHVLAAMGYSANQAKSSIRITFGYNQTVGDVDRFTRAFEEIYGKELYE